jgi:predicted nucleic acid-binding protein
MAFVLDASAALPWCFRDEATAESDRILDLAASGERFYVPAHWPSEVLNGLTRAARRGRLDDPSVERFLGDLLSYDVMVDARPISEQWSNALPLIQQYRLSAYDAAYLALAKHLRVSLATFDSRLRLAAQSEAVPLTV